MNVTKIGGDMNDMKMSDAAYERQMMCNSKKLGKIYYFLYANGCSCLLVIFRLLLRGY